MFDCDFDYKLDYKQERRPDMLLMGVMGWIVIALAVVVVAVVIGLKIKDRYF